MTHLKIINRYCNHFAISYPDLTKRRGGVMAKKVFNANTSEMRKALARYFYFETELTQAQISKILGMANHTSVSHSLRLSKNHLDNNDKVFIYYWNVLNDIVDGYKTKKTA